MRQVDVYMDQTPAGVLTEMHPGRNYEFKYNAEYLTSSLPSISLTLPKTREPYRADFLFPFFSNIIPEGGNRKVICRTGRIDEKDLFGILCRMADKEFIGAVSVKNFRIC